MKLRIHDEFSPLQSVFVCRGDELPLFENYITDDPEYLKYHGSPWDKELFLKQQDTFFTTLDKYNVELIFPQTNEKLIWQSYTRDTGFVIEDILYYSSLRKLKVRNGEDVSLLNALSLEEDQHESIPAPIEGGDVLVTPDQLYVGLGSRSSHEAAEILKKKYSVRTFMLGDEVMHLDTRLTLLPNNIALCLIDAFTQEDQDYLSKKYQLVHVTKEEASRLGTNVFIVDPETIFVPKEHQRIAELLSSKGFHIVSIDYSEPISLGGSFRCTTLPLCRK